MILKQREGLDAVKYLMCKGIPVKPFFAKGEDSNIGNYSLDLALPKEEKKERYKICLIGRLLCLDIDRKNGTDGITNFYAYLERLGIIKKKLPLYLQDIVAGSYPFYMKTPSGGLHLYFKYLGKCPDGKLCDGVEIKNKQSSGGYKDGKAYILHGDIEDIRRIAPLLLEKILPKEVKEAPRNFSRDKSCRWSKMEREGAAWDKIVKWTDEDGKGTEGKNARAYSLSVHARTHGYSMDETLANLEQDNSVNALPQKELLSVVKSAYKKAT